MIYSIICFIMVCGGALERDPYDIYCEIVERERDLSPFRAEVECLLLFDDKSAESASDMLTLKTPFTINATWFDRKNFLITVHLGELEIQRVMANGKYIDIGTEDFYAIGFLDRPLFALRSDEIQQYKEKIWPYHLVKYLFFPVSESDYGLPKDYFANKYIVYNNNGYIEMRLASVDHHFAQYFIMNSDLEVVLFSRVGKIQTYGGTILHKGNYKTFSLSYFDFTTVIPSQKKIVSRILDITKIDINDKGNYFPDDRAAGKIIPWNTKYYHRTDDKQSDNGFWTRLRNLFRSRAD